jgi:hypothetical protein
MLVERSLSNVGHSTDWNNKISENVRERSSAQCFYFGRAARRYCDYWNFGGIVVAGNTSGTRSIATRSMHEQFKANWARYPKF